MKLDLTELGFQSIGDNWMLEVAQNQIAIIAIGGKFARPGQLCRTLCVRASCMRTAEEIVPQGFVKEPFDYPVKLAPKDVLTFDATGWHYISRLLDYPRGYLTSQSECDRFAEAIQHRMIPWAETIDNSLWLEQIKNNGQNGWIEKMWMEDLASNPASHGTLEDSRP